MTESDNAPLRVLNVRIADELLKSVDSAANMAGVSRSEWVRDALEAGVHMERNAHRNVRMLGLTARETVTCVHPRPALTTVGAEVICKVCGQAVRRLL